MKKQVIFYSGIGFAVFLAVSYFIKIPLDSGRNYLTFDSLLGIIIFHNPFILAIYVLIAILLIIKGMRK